MAIAADPLTFSWSLGSAAVTWPWTSPSLTPLAFLDTPSLSRKQPSIVAVRKQQKRWRKATYAAKQGGASPLLLSPHGGVVARVPVHFCTKWVVGPLPPS